MAPGGNQNAALFYFFLGASYRGSRIDRVFSPPGRNEREMGDYSEWFGMSCDWSTPSLSLWSGSYWECHSDRTTWDYLWSPVVIRGLQGPQSLIGNMTIVG